MVVQLKMIRKSALLDSGEPEKARRSMLAALLGKDSVWAYQDSGISLPHLSETTFSFSHVNSHVQHSTPPNNAK